MGVRMKRRRRPPTHSDLLRRYPRRSSFAFSHKSSPITLMLFAPLSEPVEDLRLGASVYEGEEDVFERRATVGVGHRAELGQRALADDPALVDDCDTRAEPLDNLH